MQSAFVMSSIVTNRFAGASGVLRDSWAAFLLAVGFCDLLVVEPCLAATLNKAQAHLLTNRKVTLWLLAYVLRCYDK